MRKTFSPKIQSSTAFRIALLCIIVVAAGFYFIFDPMQTSFMPQCIFHKVTGLQCMGCGTQRAIHSLLHGDLAGAFKVNALVTILMPFLLFFAWIELYRKSYPRLYAKVFTPLTIYIISALLLGWFVLRNIIGI